MRLLTTSLVGLTLAAVLSLTACTAYTAVGRAVPEGPLPETYTLYGAGGEKRPQRWWSAFGSSELDRLVETALAGDFSIRTARARLRQVEAQAAIADASRMPELSLRAGGAGERRRRNDRTTAAESYSLALAAAYEVDWWGRLEAERQAARLDAVAAADDVRAAAMTIAGEVALRWIDIIAQKARRRLLEAQLATSQTYLELVRLRFSKGMVSALDVYQQQQVVEQVRAELPLLAETEASLRSALALLLGQPPGIDLDVAETALPVLPSAPAAGIPADLLANRPDIQAAGRRLAAADWQIAAARANRLPALTLSASAGLAAVRLDRILEDWLAELAANLVAPIHDGGKREALVEQRRAEADQALWQYRQTVYRALKEVQDALAGEDARRRHLAALQRELEVARQALDQAVLRYRKGLSDYLPVLTHLTAVQQLERETIARHSELLHNRVTLYRALGGRWGEDWMASVGDR